MESNNGATGLHYIAEKRTHGDADRFTKNVPIGQNVLLQNCTENRLAEQYNVSNRTIKRDAQLAEGVTAIGLTSLLFAFLLHFKIAALLSRYYFGKFFNMYVQM